jgi:DNA-binding NarL/FixJ family response regulator
MNTDAPTRARILIVDDHPVVRVGIRQMIAAQPTLTVCGEAGSVQEALRMALSSTYDLAIVDLSLEDGHGLELIRGLQAAAPALPVLVLSMHDETLFAERALRAGARGYIMKHEAIHGLIDAIRQVLAGRVYLSDRMSQILLQRVGGVTAGAEGPLGILSDREIEVFELTGRGMSSSAIAESLGVSVKTVETYRANIKSKLSLEDIAALVRFATSWTERL